MPITEKEPRPITVEAFRFVRLKKPEIFTGLSSSSDFITHPDLTASLVLAGIGDANFVFEGYSSLSVLKNMNPALYSFMFWLKDNKGKLQHE